MRQTFTTAQVDAADALLRELDINPDATHTAVYHICERSGGFISRELATELVRQVRLARRRAAEQPTAPLSRREILDRLQKVASDARDRHREMHTHENLMTTVRELDHLFADATVVQDGEPQPAAAPAIGPPPGYMLESFPKVDSDGVITVRLRKREDAAAVKPPRVRISRELAKDVLSYLECNRRYPASSSQLEDDVRVAVGFQTPNTKLWMDRELVYRMTSRLERPARGDRDADQLRRRLLATLV